MPLIFSGRDGKPPPPAVMIFADATRVFRASRSAYLETSAAYTYVLA